MSTDSRNLVVMFIEMSIFQVRLLQDDFSLYIYTYILYNTTVYKISTYSCTVFACICCKLPLHYIYIYIHIYTAFTVAHIYVYIYSFTYMCLHSQLCSNRNLHICKFLFTSFYIYIQIAFTFAFAQSHTHDSCMCIYIGTYGACLTLHYITSHHITLPDTT